jgi:HEAT repeat protein
MLKTEPKRRYIAAWALGKLKAEAAVDPLISALAEKNDALQKESTRALIAIGAPAVPALIKALDSSDGDVRAYSARALGIIEDKRAEEPLIRHIKDENTTVAAAAALALGTAGTEASVRPLIAALKAPDMMTRVNATISLGTLNAKDAVEPLTAIMDADEDPYVREWSARALENITGNRYKYKDEHGMTVYPYNLYR